MFIKKIKYFYFIENFNLKELEKIKKNQNIHIIYYYTKDSNFKDILSLESYSKKNRIKFYISNYSDKFSNIKISGIHIPSINKKKFFNLKKSFEIIGTAHNQIEFYIKKNQGCNIVFLSPIFKTQKYSDNKILGINRFKLICKYWTIPILALGGVKEKNYNNLGNLKIQGVGSASYFK
jgi:thiamine-phosphate pyrophosphorylase